MAFVRHAIDINGCKLSFVRAGKGAPLLYLHGTDGLAEWPAILDTLAERFDVIVPDHPGFGASEAPAWIDDVSDVAYCYLDAIEALGLSDIHVVGQSLGGWIALEMAVRSTHRLRSLTLISAAGIHVKGVPKADIFMIDPEEHARLAYADPKKGAEAAERAGASTRTSPFSTASPARVSAGSHASSIHGWSAGCIGSRFRPRSSGATATGSSPRPMPRPFTGSSRDRR